MKLKYNDGNHAYWFTPDDGASRRCKSVTTVAKIPDDTYTLDKWKTRMVAIGMAMEPPLVERAAAHYDDRDQLNRIAEEAMTAARAHEAAGRGTAAHRIAERVDMGEMLIDTPFSRAVADAWQRALKSAGLEILPEYIERIVVYPELFLAGRFDRFVKVKRTGKVAVLDLKTGVSAINYPHAMAVQLALYANAPFMAGPIPGDGGETELFEKLPEKLDRKWGYIVHMPGDDKVAVHKIDIAAGWDVAKTVIFPTLKWRARSDLTEPVAEQEVTIGSASDERLGWIRGRLALLAMVDGARDMVAARWPAGITPKTDWTDAEVDVLDEMFATVERDCGAQFPTGDPLIQQGVT